jgi:hypothetical protein
VQKDRRRWMVLCRKRVVTTAPNHGMQMSRGRAGPKKRSSFLSVGRQKYSWIMRGSFFA